MKGPPRTIAIIPSAGKGRRLGLERKPYLVLNKKPILAHTLGAFEECPLIDGVIVVTAPSDIEYCRRNIVERYGLKKVIGVIAGGKEREDSVRRGLNGAGGRWDFVVVHDGVRPFVTREIIERTLRAAYRYGCAACAVQPKDTIKEVSAGTVKKTFDRNTLAAVQTPQAFRFNLLEEACKKTRGKPRATDDSSLVERLGWKVRIVPGSYENIKITTEEDLIFARSILSSRKARAKG